MGSAAADPHLLQFVAHPQQLQRHLHAFAPTRAGAERPRGPRGREGGRAKLFQLSPTRPA